MSTESSADIIFESQHALDQLLRGNLKSVQDSSNPNPIERAYAAVRQLEEYKRVSASSLRIKEQNQLSIAEGWEVFVEYEKGLYERLRAKPNEPLQVLLEQGAETVLMSVRFAVNHGLVNGEGSIRNLLGLTKPPQTQSAK